MERNDGNLKQFIQEICKETGPRASGSPQEEKAAKLLKKKLEAWGVETSLEDFKVAPRSFHVLFSLIGLGFVTAFGLYFLVPPVSMILIILLLSFVVFRTVLGWDIAGLLCRKSRSWNVVGRIKPKGVTKQILLFSGHHDSAFRMPLLTRRLFRLLYILLPLLILSALILFALSAWRTFMVPEMWGPGVDRSIAEIAALSICGAGAASALVLVFGLIRKDAVMGANDNLSGVAVALATLQEAIRKTLDHTEVWFLSFGSEEAGLVGSKDFVRRHKEEIKDAVLINVDAVGQTGTLRLITGELMAAARHKKTALALIDKAAESTGIEIKKKYLAFGMTDAASFSRKGLTAAALLRLNEIDFLDHYHNPGDDVPSLREKNLQETLKVCRKIVEYVDAGEYPGHNAI